MGKDIISRTPGGERILVGAILLLFGVVLFKATEFKLGLPIRMMFAAIGAFGVVQVVRGLITWKYADRNALEKLVLSENLLIDVPLKEGNPKHLHLIEDTLINALRTDGDVIINNHAMDRPNAVGTMYLSGESADELYRKVHAPLCRVTRQPNVPIFPKFGQRIDPEIGGKRVLLDVRTMEMVN